MNILEITQVYTLEDRVERALVLSARTGELKRYTRRLVRAEIIGSVLGIVTVYGVYFFFTFINEHPVFLHYLVIAFTVIFCIDVLFTLICRNKRAVKKLKKAYARHYKDSFVCRQLGAYTDKAVITDDYLEADTLGVLTRIYHKDFIDSFETELFYVLEYAHFCYAFIKKDAVQSDEYRRAVQFIREKKDHHV